MVIDSFAQYEKLNAGLDCGDFLHMYALWLGARRVQAKALRCTAKGARLRAPFALSDKFPYLFRKLHYIPAPDGFG